jgi:hypothetical protein
MNWKGKLITQKAKYEMALPLNIMWHQNFLLLPILNTKSFILLMKFVKICTKGERLIRIRFTFKYLNISKEEYIFFNEKTVLFSWRNMDEQQLKSIFDREENITRLKILFFSAFWPLVNFTLHFSC